MDMRPLGPGHNGNLFTLGEIRIPVAFNKLIEGEVRVSLPSAAGAQVQHHHRGSAMQAHWAQCEVLSKGRGEEGSALPRAATTPSRVPGGLLGQKAS